MATLPNYVQLDSPLEFTRLVCALERSPRVSFLHEHNGKKVLSVQMDLLKEKPENLICQQSSKAAILKKWIFHTKNVMIFNLEAFLSHFNYRNFKIVGRLLRDVFF